MAYSKQTWDTTSYVNPTRMNHIEDGIYDATTPTTITTGLVPESDVSVVGFQGAKQGGLITIGVLVQPTFSAYGNKNLATLPQGYRPSSTIRFVAANVTKDTQINATIDSNGLISVYATSENVNLSAQNITFIATYV